MGWQIVRHSFVLLFGNFAEALKVSAGPVLIGAVAVVLLGALFGASPMLLAGPADATGVDAATAFLALAAVLVYLFVISWIAVAWHRFILLEDYPSALLRLRGLPVLAYAGRAVLVALVLVLAAVPVVLVMAALTAGLGLGASPGAAVLLSFVIGVVFTFLWLRIALVLPATAVGRPFGIREAWQASARASGDILQATFIVVGLNALATLAAQLLFGIGVLALAANLLISWITLMVGTSLLTTLYGHLVEGRDLA